MKNDLKNSNRTRDDSDWRELAAQTRAQRRAKGMSEPPVDVEKVAAEWAAEREAASKPAHWNKILLSLEEADEMLKRATFIIRLGKEKDQQGEEYYTWGTGFFFTPELALTTDHNPRPYPEEKSFLAYYQGSEIQFEWVKSWSSDHADIAVMRCIKKPKDVSIEPLSVTYLDPAIPRRVRNQFWGGRPICIYGYPCRGNGQEGWRIDGMIDAAMPLVTTTEVDKDGYGGTITREIERLNMIGSRISELEGISGGAIFDREGGCVIGVEGLYDPESGQVRGTEIAQLIDEHPALESYFQPIFTPPEQLAEVAALTSSQDEQLPSAVPTAGTSQPLKVRVWAQLESAPLARRLVVESTKHPDAVFKVGDYVRIGFYANRDAHIYLLNVNPEGKVMQLFPAENRVRGEQNYFIPTADDDFQLPVEGPLGVDTLIAVATAKPAPVLDEYRKSSKLLSRRALRLSEEYLAHAAGALSCLPREQWALGQYQFLVRG